MMIMNRKGMTMALGVIIAIVVLIVVALAVIAITTGSLSNLFGTTTDQGDTTAVRMKCNAWFTNWCLTHPGEDAPASDAYPTITVGTVEEACNSDLILGTDKKCGAVTST